MLKARLGSDQPPEMLTEISQFPVRWSPRGDWIAYRLRRELRLVSPDGQKNVQRPRRHLPSDLRRQPLTTQSASRMQARDFSSSFPPNAQVQLPRYTT